MARRRTPARIVALKAAIWVAALVPLAVLLWDAFHGTLAAEPVKDIQHRTGRTAVILLFSALAITPLRRLTGRNELIRFRRLLGLFAFFYAVLHFGSYLLFDLQFAFGDLARDVAKRPWITIGFSVFLILLALAVTSPQAVLRKLGGKRWQRIHRLVYVAAVGAVLHFILAQKRDIHLPLIYAAVLAVLLLARLVPRRQVGGQRAGVIESSP
jgi:methionine sulfoxide reductase heme-binding subunit